jgi:hypothetical protein
MRWLDVGPDVDAFFSGSKDGTATDIGTELNSTPPDENMLNVLRIFLQTSR